MPKHLATQISHMTHEGSEVLRCCTSSQAKMLSSECTSVLPMTASELVLHGYLLYGHACSSSSDCVRPSTYADINGHAAPDKCSSREPSSVLRSVSMERGATTRPSSHKAVCRKMFAYLEVVAILRSLKTAPPMGNGSIGFRAL